MFWFKKRQKNKPIIHRKARIGLALGGGGARGIGHIGVLMAFNELGIDFEFVSGTSAGAIIGSLYCAGFTASELEQIVKSLKVSDIKRRNLFFMPTSTEKLEETLLKIFNKDIVFSELDKPFTAVCVNIKDGSEVKINSGSVIKAVCASSAVPGVFKPVVYRGMHLVDGGLSNNVPADVAREMGANVVIAVDVNPTRGKGTESLKLTSILSSTVGVMMQKNIETKLAYADMVIIPELGEFKSSKLNDVDLMIKRGYEAVMNRKEEILALLKRGPKLKKIVWHLKNKRKKS